MGDVQATVVIEFGATADNNAFVVLELDGDVNKDSSGKTTTSFHPGDRPGFVVHYDPDLLRVGKVQSSSGQVTGGGSVPRDRTSQVQFTESKKSVDLPHIPAQGVTIDWYGNSPAIESLQKRHCTVSGQLPAIGTANYQIACNAYRIIPPPLELGPDDHWPILIVVSMEAA